MIRTSLLAAFAFCLIAAAALTACGGDDSPKATPAANALDDKQYLAVLCEGLTNYYVAINNKPDAAGISQVIKEYIASMQKVTPPSDLVKWQEGYLKYLAGVVDEPTKALTQSPPLPTESVRKRLADQVTDVPQCKVQTFLGEKRPPP